MSMRPAVALTGVGDAVEWLETMGQVMTTGVLTHRAGLHLQVSVSRQTPLRPRP